eukprot:scaffold38862_cov222-Skeletonema_dohrnii-CCMP3373.AAC.1
MMIIDSNGSTPDNSLGEVVVLNNLCDVEFILHHCNQSLADDNDSIDVTSTLRAVENEVLEIALLSTTNHQINVSINLLQFDSLHDDNLNAAPPIPAPRLLPRNKKNKLQKLSKPHSSYNLIQALSGVFEGSIFDDVAKSCFVPDSKNAQQQVKTRQKQAAIITAKMVYSVVDNVNSKEYEQPSSGIGPSPSD